ncbi:MAG: hypothetical protein QXJ28_01190 [Candidatus Pacearchaeota archaeon]
MNNSPDIKKNNEERIATYNLNKSIKELIKDSEENKEDDKVKEENLRGYVNHIPSYTASTSNLPKEDKKESVEELASLDHSIFIKENEEKQLKALGELFKKEVDEKKEKKSELNESLDIF